MPCYRWSKAEEEVLFSMAGDIPQSMLLGAFKRWANQNGFPPRTTKAILRRLHTNGYGVSSFGEYINTTALGQILGLHCNTVRRWIRRGYLRGHQEGVKWYVSRQNLRRLARKRPDLFAGKPEPELNQALCDKRLAAHLAQLPRPAGDGKRYPVKCVETGRVYPSLAEAARATYVTRQAITLAIRFGGTSGGYHWARP